MKAPATQRGVVVLVLLVLTSLAGSALLAVHSSRASTAAQERALIKKSELLHARDALISYTTHYPYLYGPRGAGVGHFPCPDTDSSMESTTRVWSLRLGPNPPCGSHTTEQGWLPAHISFPNHRYSFNADINVPVSYQVSGRFINNPVNRAVNPDVVMNTHKASIPVVKLYQRFPQNEASYPNNFSAVITPAMLLLSTKPAVASWFVSRVSQLSSLQCATFVMHGLRNQQEPLLGFPNPPEVENSQEADWCSQFYEITKQCEKTIRFPSGFMMESEVVDTYEFSEANNDHSQFNILLVSDEFPNEYDCEKSPESQLFIEGVLATSHWFVRNHWESWLKLMIDDDCLVDTLFNCEFEKFDELSEKTSPLVVRWGLE